MYESDNQYEHNIDIFELIHSLDSDILENKQEIIQKFGKELKYGDEFLLMHTHSGLFLKACKES